LFHNISGSDFVQLQLETDNEKNSSMRQPGKSVPLKCAKLFGLDIIFG
jgi:hypothetical protein